MRKSLLAVLVCLALTAMAVAGEAAGVKMPDSATVEGKALKLNGLGLRKKVFFKVYVAGLYLETPGKDAAKVISSDQVKSIKLHILRGLKGSQVAEAIAEGFERNSKAQMGALKARLDKLNAMIPDVVEGDQIVLTYVPGKGTLVSAKGGEKGIAGCGHVASFGWVAGLPPIRAVSVALFLTNAPSSPFSRRRR